MLSLRFRPPGLRACAAVLMIVGSACYSSDFVATSSGDPVSDYPDGGPTADASEDPPSSRDPDAGGPAKRKKVLVLGLDGVRFDRLAKLAIPNLRALANEGVLSQTWLYSGSMAETVSGPGWSTITTGVWPDKHGVRNNQFKALANGHQDFLSRIEQLQPSLNTYAAADWNPLATIILGDAIDDKLGIDAHGVQELEASAERITVDAAGKLTKGNIDAAFVYFCLVDAVGHALGARDAYDAAIERTDERVGRLIAAVEARASRAEEDWLIVVTTDHGHMDAGGHGGASWQERQSFILASGGGFARAKFATKPRNVDIVPTVLSHLGLSPRPEWRLDGRPLGTPSHDPFDSLIGSLKPAQDESAVPAAVLGWTHDAPAGWSVVNAPDMPKGTTEWQGWSFVTDEFWTSAELGQQREAFVLGRGVIAVADSDEWNDVGGASARGAFDSTLQSAPYAVVGGSRPSLRFATHYRQLGNLRATVTVSFDSGAQQTLLEYGPDVAADNAGVDVINHLESLAFDVPVGVSSMVVRFRLFQGRNDLFWAIDEPWVE